MPAVRLAAAAVLCCALATGCTSASLAENLGSVSYVRDRQPSSLTVTTFYVGAQIDTLVDEVRGLQAPQLAQRIEAVDATTHVVVTLYFDACAKEQPDLVLTGSTLSVRYGTVLNRNCVRAVDTLTVFAVPRSRLPDPAVLEACGRQVTLSGDTVRGDPIGLC